MERIEGKKIICVADSFSKSVRQSGSGVHNSQRTTAYGTNAPAKAYVSMQYLVYKHKPKDATLGLKRDDRVEGEEIMLSHKGYPFPKDVGGRKQGTFDGEPACAWVNKRFTWSTSKN